MTAYNITHVVHGQIPNHQALKVDYSGSLGANGYFKVIDDSLVPTVILPEAYPNPNPLSTISTH